MLVHDENFENAFSFMDLIPINEINETGNSRVESSFFEDGISLWPKNEKYWRDGANKRLKDLFLPDPLTISSTSFVI